MDGDTGRIAFIFGNDDYMLLKTLHGAVNDADNVAKTLNNSGFAIHKFTNLNHQEFRDRVNEFKYKCMEYNVGLFYYAGHGFEYKGNNYLCPIDGDPDKMSDTNINISNLVNEISKDRDFVCIVILDCCRNIYLDNERRGSSVNPIVANFNNPGGTFIAYSTSSGESANEIRGYGVYTKILCSHIQKSKCQIEQIFKNVRKEMLENFCNGDIKRQISWEYSSLISEFYFNEEIEKGYKQIAMKAIDNSYQYKKIVNCVENYCKKNKCSDIDKILLNVLNEIDNILEEREDV